MLEMIGMPSIQAILGADCASAKVFLRGLAVF